MIKSRKILAVFLASPSDLQAERQYARECVDEWNEVNADRSGWFVELMGWEDTLPQAGRPQEIINQEVDKCVLFVGMMHRLWGNPTGSGATSGFHEEFTRAADRYDKSDEPFISLFFKEIGDVTDPGDQLSKVIDFRQEITNSKKFFYKSLSSDALIWNAHFRRNLHKLIFKIIDDHGDTGRNVSESDSADAATGLVQALPLDVASRANLSALENLTSKITGEHVDSNVAPVDIARLRLIATSWQAPGLAEAFLPTHDANIIFRLAEDEELSRPEVLGLIETGLSNFTLGNAPIWRWIQKEDSKMEFVRSIAIFANEYSAKSGALELLALADDDFGEWSSMLEEHFNIMSNKEKNAVLRYIASTSAEKFEKLALSEFRRGEYATRNSAILAICAIKNSLSATAALHFLLEENVFPSGWDSSAVIDAVEILTDDGLLKAVQHREPDVRSAAVRALAKRDLINVTLSSALKSDPSPKVRMAAVVSARNAGEQISISDAATIIVRKSANALLPGSKDGEAEFEEYRENAMADLPDAIVEQELESYYAPSETAYKVLLSRHWKARADLARRDVSDNFDRHFADLAEFHTAKYGEAAAKLAALPEHLKGYIAAKRVRAALDIFSLKGAKEDIRLFRVAAESPFFQLAKDDLIFFSRFGEWGDIPLIASASRRSGGSLLSPTVSCSECDVANTILRIAKNREGECLLLDLPLSIKAVIVRSMSKAAFKRISHSATISLLGNESDEVRKAVAVRVAETFSKVAAVEMIEKYMEQSYLYYNVIHWLDLRVSAPSAVATFIAERCNATS